MKLTIKNYKEAVKDIDFSKLPEPVQEAHNDYDAFVEFYHDDKDIKEMIDNHFKLVEPYLKDTKPKAKKWDIIFTDAGGWIIASNKNEKQYGDYRIVAKINRDNGKVSWTIPKLEVPDDAMMKIKDFAKKMIEEIRKKENSNLYPIEDERKVKRQPAKNNKGPRTKRTTKKKTPVKKTTSKRAKRKAHEVALMPIEIKIIRRYLNMHGKNVTERQVSLLYKVIQKAATEKTIRKTSKYADEIMKIGNDLAKTYKEMEGTCTFEVPKSMYGKLKAVVDSYGVSPAVTLIKRFINLYGKITVEKAQRLLTSIKNAKKNGKVTKSDSSYDRINRVQKHLENYLESDKLIVTKIELKGLQGVTGMGK